MSLGLDPFNCNAPSRMYNLINDHGAAWVENHGNAKVCAAVRRFEGSRLIVPSIKTRKASSAASGQVENGLYGI